MNNRHPNPYITQSERAPYELGHLLMQMPVDFTSSNPLTTEERLIIEAAREHVIFASETLMDGLEALGQVMFVAGANKRLDVNGDRLASLGCLISHLSAEMQFLHETEYSIREKLEMLDARAASEARNSPGQKASLAERIKSAHER